jgi:UDP-N-acetylglucosamine--N-acetylmuramyl-(pentapeptide) pyrophosphoryl-undecaprenol N-acetylglucosamine transferase
MMNNAPLKVVIMAGGTGGHVFPALAVAEKLRQRGASISWLGTAAGIESELVPAANITLHCLSIEGVRGKGLAAKLKAPWLLLTAVWQARKILQQEQADVVLGLGGFASGPGGVAAWLLRKPLLIHEQNAVAGTTNSWLSKIANRVMEAFPGSLADAVHVGNPVRDSIAAVQPLSLEKEGALKLLVLGGSLGALALNQLLPEALAQLPKDLRPQVKHQTGKRHLAVTKAGYELQSVDAEVVEFIADMAAAYEWADLVICRAGALTVSELTLAGRAALLVPFPFAIDDHQTKNAQWLVDNKAGVLYQQADLTAELTANFIKEFTQDREKLEAMSRSVKMLAMPDAADKVADFCEQAARGTRQETSNG